MKKRFYSKNVYICIQTNYRIFDRLVFHYRYHRHTLHHTMNTLFHNFASEPIGIDLPLGEYAFPLIDRSLHLQVKKPH